tara:strand:+ start:233622 stop:234176 length:555 start_codon:yes stop_codon:yes gene_type:complete
MKKILVLAILSIAQLSVAEMPIQSGDAEAKSVSVEKLAILEDIIAGLGDEEGGEISETLIGKSETTVTAAEVTLRAAEQNLAEAEAERDKIVAQKNKIKSDFGQRMKLCKVYSDEEVESMLEDETLASFYQISSCEGVVASYTQFLTKSEMQTIVADLGSGSSSSEEGEAFSSDWGVGTNRTGK